jgi:hypothetical protein
LLINSAGKQGRSPNMKGKIRRRRRRRRRRAEFNEL